MPVLDGREFLKIFRADSSNDKIPVLVLSTDDTQKRTVMELGAAGFIIKPINEDELIEKIQEFTQL
jgi:CheY-like chemotaxis protein